MLYHFGAQREVDLDIELLGRRVLGESSDGAQQDEAKAKPSTARQPPNPREK